jgi:hypothetical protein
MITTKDIDAELATRGLDPNGQPLQQNMQSQAQAAPASPESLTNNPLANYYKGFGHAVASTGADLANLLPGVNINVPQFGQGTAYNLGSIGGNIGTFVAGGEGVDALRAAMAAKNIPLLSKVAGALGGEGVSGVARRAIGAGGYGALTNPNDRSQGAGLNSALSVGLDAIPGVAGVISGVKQGLSAPVIPDVDSMAQSIKDSLSKGMSIEDSGKDLASKVNDLSKQERSNYGQQYQNIFDQVGNQSIYGDIKNRINSGNLTDESGNQIFNFGQIGDDIKASFAPKTYDMFQSFTKSPTLQNAHELQSQLGGDIRQLQKSQAAGTLQLADAQRLNGYMQARDAIKTDMSQFFDRNNPELGQQYAQTTQGYQQNVGPFNENRNLSMGARG